MNLDSFDGRWTTVVAGERLEKHRLASRDNPERARSQLRPLVVIHDEVIEVLHLEDVGPLKAKAESPDILDYHIRDVAPPPSQLRQEELTNCGGGNRLTRVEPDIGAKRDSHAETVGCELDGFRKTQHRSAVPSHRHQRFRREQADKQSRPSARTYPERAYPKLDGIGFRGRQPSGPITADDSRRHDCDEASRRPNSSRKHFPTSSSGPSAAPEECQV